MQGTLFCGFICWKNVLVMKRIFLITALSLLSLGAFAQGSHEINVMVGGYKSEFLQADNSGLFEFIFGDFDTELDHSGDLADLYEPHYYMKSGPVLVVCYHYGLNSWLRLGAQTSLSSVSGTVSYRMGNRSRSQFKQTMIDILPEAKLMIPSARHFRLYGKVAAGVQVNLGELMSEGPVTFAWDITPIGAEWGGQRVYGNVEFCWGNVIRGIRIGMGFRF